MRVALKRPPRPHYLCEEHHVFNGRGLRELSEKYNCVIYISPDYHRAIHNSARIRMNLKADFQERLEAAGWARAEFIETFGKSYL